MQAYATEHAGMTEVEAVALFLQFVPLEGELLDFFHPLTSQILNLLRGTASLPTDPLHAPGAWDDEAGTCPFHVLVTPSSKVYARERAVWRQPSQILLVPEEFIREHISQLLLEKALKLSYLHPAMLPHVNFSLKSQLHIQSMTLQHLKEVARVAMDAYCAIHSPDQAWDSLKLEEEEEEVEEGLVSLNVTPRQLFVQWIANWLACVHILLEEGGGVAGGGAHAWPARVEMMKDLPLLPLEDGRLVAATEGGIFFPPDYRGNASLPYCCTEVG